MEATTLMNPFVVGKYVSGHYFCDRATETELLMKHALNGRNVALISPRRMGKTGLIQHSFHQQALSSHYHLFFIDIYATSSLSEFVYLLGKTVYETLRPKKTVWVERFFEVVKSLRIGFKLDAYSGEPSFDLGLGDIQMPELTLDEIFKFLETADKPCLVAIDEFQQIASYEEKNMEALLRTKIQQCRQTQFIFAGSKRHMMSNMFNSPAKPFYQSAITMGLEAIPLPVYTAFAQKMFDERGKQVEPAVVEKVYKTFEGCTWFMQLMMNELFAITPPLAVCGLNQWEVAWNNIIALQEISFKELLSRLSSKQKMVLIAIAKEGYARGITSAAFIKKYGLASPSSVQSALKPLLASDIVTQDEDNYRVYDYFLREWLAREF